MNELIEEIETLKAIIAGLQQQLLRVGNQQDVLKAAYLAEGGTGPAVRLQLTYPRLRSHRNLEIVFRNVPLPTARPE